MNNSLFPSHRGFTLIELLVVIAIIGILAGVLMASFSGGTESARTARCLSNMRNLAAAVQTYGQEHQRYPHAGSIEYMTIDESEGVAHVKARYHEEPGWISWYSKGTYQQKPTSHQASSAWMTSMYVANDIEARYCLTNGALWKYVSGNLQTYLCPSHSKMKSNRPHWSYLMNAYFGWDSSEGSSSEGQNFDHIEYGRLNRADRVLLFSEIPFTGKVGSWDPDSDGSGLDCDCVLQFDTSVKAKFGSLGINPKGAHGTENIGFNHRSGKMTFANVVFADGHVEKMRLPPGGLSGDQLKNLTSWLCMGEDVAFDGKEYKALEN